LSNKWITVLRFGFFVHSKLPPVPP
jgi:hypothetical protein